METLAKDEFLHLTDISELMGKLQKQSDWGKSEAVKQVFEELQKLPRFTITIERDKQR